MLEKLQAKDRSKLYLILSSKTKRCFFGWVRQLFGAKFAASVVEILEATKRTLLISYFEGYTLTLSEPLWSTPMKPVLESQELMESYQYLVIESRFTAITKE